MAAPSDAGSSKGLLPQNPVRMIAASTPRDGNVGLQAILEQ